MIGLLRRLEARVGGRSKGRPCRSLPRSAFERLLDFDSSYPCTFDPWAAGPILSRLTSAAFILRAHGQAQRAEALESLTESPSITKAPWCGVLTALTELAGTGPAETASLPCLAGFPLASRRLARRERKQKESDDTTSQDAAPPAPVSGIWEFEQGRLLSQTPDPHLITTELSGLQRAASMMGSAPDPTDVHNACRSMVIAGGAAPRSRFERRRERRRALGLLIAPPIGTISSSLIPIDSNAPTRRAWGATSRHMETPPPLHAPSAWRINQATRKQPQQRKLDAAATAIQAAINADMRKLRESWRNQQVVVSSANGKTTQAESKNCGIVDAEAASIRQALAFASPIAADWDGMPLATPDTGSRLARGVPRDFDVIYSAYFRHGHQPAGLLVSERELSDRAMAALQGIPSVLFPPREGAPARHDLTTAPCRLRSCSARAMSELLGRVAGIGSTYRALVAFTEKFSTADNGGLVLESFAEAVGEFLHLFCRRVMEIPEAARARRGGAVGGCGGHLDESLGDRTGSEAEIPAPTLLEIETHTETLRGQIMWLADICQCDVGSSGGASGEDDVKNSDTPPNLDTFPRGGRLLSYLFQCGTLSSGQSATDPLFQFLFTRACRPYIGMLQSWVFQGRIRDPFGEFMVRPVDSGDGETPTDGRRFELVASRNIPSFLRDSAARVLECGSAVLVAERSRSAPHLAICRATGGPALRMLSPCFTTSAAAALAQDRSIHARDRAAALDAVSARLESTQMSLRAAARRKHAASAAELRQRAAARDERRRLAQSAEFERRRGLFKALQGQVAANRVYRAAERKAEREADEKRQAEAKARDRAKIAKAKAEMLRQHEDHMRVLGLQRQRLQWRKRRQAVRARRDELVTATEASFLAESKAQGGAPSEDTVPTAPAPGAVAMAVMGEPRSTFNASNTRFGVTLPSPFGTHNTSIKLSPKAKETSPVDESVAAHSARAHAADITNNPIERFRGGKLSPHGPNSRPRAASPRQSDAFLQRFSSKSSVNEEPVTTQTSRQANPELVAPQPTPHPAAAAGRGRSWGGGKSTVLLGTYTGTDQKQGEKRPQSNAAVTAEPISKRPAKVTAANGKGDGVAEPSSVDWIVQTAYGDGPLLDQRRAGAQGPGDKPEMIFKIRLKFGIAFIAKSRVSLRAAVALRGAAADGGTGNTGGTSQPVRDIVQEDTLSESPVQESPVRALWSKPAAAAAGNPTSVGVLSGEEGPLSCRLRTLFAWSLAEGIREQHNTANAVLCHLLLDEFKLSDHLGALRRYLLMNAGDLFDTFSRTLFAGLKADPKIDWTSVANLNSAFESAVRVCGYERDPMSKHLRFGLRRGADMRNAQLEMKSSSLRALDHAQLSYKVEWPLSAVIEEAHLRSYGAIFSFLLQIKRLTFELRSAWERMASAKRRFNRLNIDSGGARKPKRKRRRSKPKGRSQRRLSDGSPSSKLRSTPSPQRRRDPSSALPEEERVRTSQALARWRVIELFFLEMRHLISNLEGYIMTQALAMPWAQLQSDMSGAHTLRALRRAHTRFVETAMNRCFQSDETAKLRDHVYRIFEKILRFKSRAAACDLSDPLSGVSAEAFSDMEIIAEETRGDCRLLFRIMRVLARRGFEPMRDLVTRLDYNRFLSKRLFGARTMVAPRTQPE